MKIRKATKKDVKEIAKIFQIESSKKPYCQEWGLKGANKKIDDMLKYGTVYIAILDKKVVGFITIAGEEKKDAYVDEFWISEFYQRRGIGRLLLEFAEKQSLKKGVKSFTVMANRKAGAFKFYKKLKYKPNNEDVFLTKKLK